MILPVLQQPDPLLREKSIMVSRSTPEIKQLAADLLETMYALGNGVGLAAPQVGRLYRLFVFDVSEGRNQPGALLNPEIISHNKETAKHEEGCLSCRNFDGVVERYTKVTVRGLNLDGKKVTIKAEGLLARVFQHEIDHLDGILIIDKAEPVPPEQKRSK
ncbi:peptide deformylase [Candidatus Termititenax persephonae]|uniref:Peptide deformylase n=1 Tax=Candidatus Termititenax persephonae TaxID=2218525 RepID=A0A388TGU1_9BACT|nr:peptide deformylase [Candidatus Termititenax persephonae]